MVSGAPRYATSICIRSKESRHDAMDEAREIGGLRRACNAHPARIWGRSCFRGRLRCIPDRRRAAARPRLVRSKARDFLAAAGLFSLRKVKRILSPTKRRMRSPLPGVMIGLNPSTCKNFSRKRRGVKCKSKKACLFGLRWRLRLTNLAAYLLNSIT